MGIVTASLGVPSRPARSAAAICRDRCKAPGPRLPRSESHRSRRGGGSRAGTLRPSGRTHRRVDEDAGHTARAGGAEETVLVVVELPASAASRNASSSLRRRRSSVTRLSNCSMRTGFERVGRSARSASAASGPAPRGSSRKSREPARAACAGARAGAPEAACATSGRARAARTRVLAVRVGREAPGDGRGHSLLLSAATVRPRRNGVELDEELGWHGVRIELALRTEATNEDGRRPRDLEWRHDVPDP